MSFASDVSRFNKKTTAAIDKTVRGVTFLLFRSVILASPVDTGRFRGNWQASVNSPKDGTLDKTDPSGGMTVANMALYIGGAGSVTYLANNLPYAQRLEYEGWSSQAPGGMVRINVARLDGLLRAEALKNKV